MVAVHSKVNFVHACVRMFVHLQELRVDLELRYRPALLGGRLPPFLNALEQVVDSPGDDPKLVPSDVNIKARAHGVSLPGSRLNKNEEENKEPLVVLPERCDKKLSIWFFLRIYFPQYVLSHTYVHSVGQHGSAVCMFKLGCPGGGCHGDKKRMQH